MEQMKIQTLMNEVIEVLLPLLLRSYGDDGARAMDLEKDITEIFRSAAELNNEKLILRPHVLHGVLNNFLEEKNHLVFSQNRSTRMYKIKSEEEFHKMYSEGIKALFEACKKITETIEQYYQFERENRNDSQANRLKKNRKISKIVQKNK